MKAHVKPAAKPAAPPAPKAPVKTVARAAPTAAAKVAAKAGSKAAPKAASAPAARPVAKAKRKPLKSAALVNRDKVSTMRSSRTAAGTSSNALLAAELADARAHLAAIGKLRAYLEMTPDGVIVSANDNFLRVTGYTLNEVRGQHHRMLVDAATSTHADYRDIWDKLRRGEAVAGSFAMLGQGGRPLWLQTNYNPVIDLTGAVTKIATYATDVTEQVHSTEALRLSQLHTAREVARIKQGLDVVQTNVMVADADLNVVYVNDSIKAMLAAAEADIRKDVPSFSAARVVGTNIDTFHKQPAYQRNMLASMKDTHNARLTLGGRTFSLILNPINGEAGERLGYVVEWKDLTAELAAKARELQLAAEMARVKQGLDVVVTNVMIADADLNVVYVNNSIKEMLSVAEADIKKDVPSFHAATVVGTNIDVFHKNPAYQRGMLGSMSSTHKARLVLGGRTFSLILNPINGVAGERLGYVVEWKDMTAELAQAAAEAERAAADRRRADENLRIKMALDSVTTNVMIADNDRNIVYMNGAVKDMLAAAESDIRRALPNFDVRKLDNAKIDVFHKHPEHQARMLSTFRDTHRTQIVVGGRTFSLIAAPIINAAGERLGAVVEWKDRTAEVAVENEVGSIVAAAANGDFTQRIRLDGKEGFFRGLGESLNQLLETSSVGLNEVVRVLSALAKGDLTETISNEYHGTFGQLKDDSNATVAQLTEIITQIKSATDTINVAAGEIAAGNLDLSQRTEEQAASLEETASSMEELTSTVKQNAENARQANQLALGASDVAIKGGQVVGQVVTTMTAINDSSKKIVDIISVIDGIAFQTNILALNAAVEAARAGEQGRGFAVVAAEVRSLAQRSASAAKEIKTLIGDSVEKVGNGTKLVEQAGKTMEEIVTSVKRVTDIMAEISAASQEQSSGIDQINKAITQMDQVTQQNAALVEEASAAARSMEDQAGNLSTAVSQFTLAGAREAPVREQRRPAQGSRPQPSAAARGKPVVAPISTALRRPASAAGSGAPKAARGNGGDTWTEF